MKFRVGIDADSNRWIDWGGGNAPLNLFPDPLWLNQTKPKAIAPQYVARTMERNPYGLAHWVFLGEDPHLEHTLIIYNDDWKPIDAGDPDKRYTAVVWLKSPGVDFTNVNFSVYHLVGTTPTNLKADTLKTITSDRWTKFTVKYTAAAGQEKIRFRIGRIKQTPFDQNFSVMATGFGFYKGWVDTDFSLGTPECQLEDITDYVLGMECDSGTESNLTSLTPIDGQLTLTLDNRTGIFTPRNTGSPLYGRLKPRTLVEVWYQEDDNVSEWKPLWTGFYDNLSFTPGQTTNATATLTAVQGLQYLDTERVKYTTGVNQSASQVLGSLLARPANPSNRWSWMIGSSRIGFDTGFPDPGAFWQNNLTLSLPVALVGMSSDTSVRDVFSGLVSSAPALAFIDRWGRPSAFRLESLPFRLSTDVTTALDTQSAEYMHTPVLPTQVTAKYYPKSYFDGLLWETADEDPITVEPLGTVDIMVSPKTSEGFEITPFILQPFVTGTSTFEARDSLNVDRTVEVIFRVYHAGQRLRLIIENNVNDTLTITAAIRGTGYYNRDDQEIVIANPEQVRLNEGIEVSLNVDLPYVSQEDVATLAADQLLDLAESQRDGFKSITHTFTASDANTARAKAIMAINVGDLVRITDSDTFMTDHRHIVLAERFSITPGGAVTVVHTLLPFAE